MWPSGEIWWAPAGGNGLITCDTWASGRRATTSWAVRPCTEASWMGPADVITTWAGLPAWWGNARFRICCTGCLPPVRLLEKLLPASWAPALTPTRAISQRPRTAHRWSWHHPAIRARPLSSAGREGRWSEEAVFGGRVETAMARIYRQP